MNYRINPLNGDKISLLAFGCMRFPKDFTACEELVTTAVENGVNYFDTSYIYPGSEAALGRILFKNNLRDDVFLATKLPTFFVNKSSDFDKYFDIQLERLRTNRIDYYLMHMLTSPGGWKRLVELGIEDWLADKKKKGQIKNVGFSFHGGAEDFKTLVDAYGWEFVLMMYNYYDVNNQAGKGGLLRAAEKNLPVMVMEPLRGGRLVSKLPKEAADLLNGLTPSCSPADWAFRWVYSHNEVLCALSGMESLDILKQNIKTASYEGSYELTAEQNEVFDKARNMILQKTKVPCTGCNYCMPCKSGVNVPLCFTHYNDISLQGRFTAFTNYVLRNGGHKASLCTSCGVCVKRCPQKIEIPKKLREVKVKLEGGVFIPLGAIVRKFMRA